jgi:DNA mismatch repair protein MutS
LSTGELQVAEWPDAAALRDELIRLGPAEIIYPEEAAESCAELAMFSATPVEGYPFEAEAATFFLTEQFRVHSLEGFGCADLPGAIGAAGGLLHYLSRCLRRDIAHFRNLRTHQNSSYLLIDATTAEHLELVESRAGRGGTLLGAIDRTCTPVGARTLRRWVLRPLLDLAAISARQDAIAALLSDGIRLGQLRTELSEIRDLERCSSRLSLGSGNARDLAALASSLARLPAIIELLHSLPPPTGELSNLAAQLHPLPELVRHLEDALVETPPALLREGGIIRPGFDSALDELRNASAAGKDWIAALQEREIQRTGIKSLKVRYTSVFGYFIEITKANLAAVPEDYHRKQTTVNGERFITPELKEIEGKILGADERSRALEFEIFQQLRAEALAHLESIQSTAAAIGAIDALTGLAETARLFQYSRPVLDDSPILQIEGGRHPVLEQNSTGERFVPNDTLLHGETARLAILTGPNMAGKSTYIRQVALLTLLAHLGSFVPAAAARIGRVDRIFTRIGASDDLSRGHSTFLVEMNETANILRHATDRSLVILDEIGRGTSTFDGLSLAWSIAEFLHDSIRARTLFATHYHELTDLERTREAVINLNVAVREWNEEIIFLRKILPGRADQSYGIQVARLAGVPESVLARAKEILHNLEKSELNAEGKPALAAGARRRAAAIINQPELDLFSSTTE